MLLKLAKQALMVVLVLLAGAAAFFGYMLYGERQGKARAISFCNAIRPGDDPADLLARATQAGALPDSLRWVPPDTREKRLEAVFKGGFPLSMHVCRVEAVEKVTQATYFHNR